MFSRSFLSLLSLLIFSSSTTTFAKSFTEQLKAKKDAFAKQTPKEHKAIMQKSLEEVEKAKIGKKMPNVGDPFPEISLYDEKKRRIHLKDFWESGYAVIKFYRGHWCPYCQLELKAYQDRIEKFKEIGASIVVLTPDTYRYINKTKKKFKLGFPVLQDVNNLLARQLGIIFTLNDDLLGLYGEYKINLADSQANRYNQLPLPATYVVDGTGQVIYKFAKADYTLRADPDEVIEFLKGKKDVGIKRLKRLQKRRGK
jgi:peroxiredoxin